MITGATSGLGLETARTLLANGATVVTGCRDFDKAAEAFKDVSRSCSGGALIVLELDLKSFASIRKFCDEAEKATASGINCLICNAAVYGNPQWREKTEEGFEVQLGVNHLAHFLLTNLLLPVITDRVVFVTSILMKKGRINSGRNLDEAAENLDDKQGYYNSKLMNALTAFQLKKLRPNLKVFCVSPGWCRTNLGKGDRGLPWYKIPAFLLVAALFMKSAKTGAESIVERCVSHADEGLFYRNKRHCSDFDEFIVERASIAEQLWQLSLTLVDLN